MTILSSYTGRNLTVDAITPKIIDEFNRQKSNSAVSLASRLSTVKKRPAEGSSWQNQKKKKQKKNKRESNH